MKGNEGGYPVKSLNALLHSGEETESWKAMPGNTARQLRPVRRSLERPGGRVGNVVFEWPAFGNGILFPGDVR
jgi:hypothetical protein